MLSKKPWELERVLVLVVAFLVCFSMFLFLGMTARYFGSINPFIHLLMITLPLHASVLLAATVALWRPRVRWREAFGFSTPGKGRAILLGILAAGIFLPVGYLLQFLSIQMLTGVGLAAPEQHAVTTLQQTETWDTRAYLIVFALLMAPVAEEILFRGIMYPAIKQFGYPRAALWVTSVLFAIIHFNSAAFVPLMVLGMALVWLYEKTDNLLAPIAAHATFNAFNLIAMYWGNDLLEMLRSRLHFHI